MKSSILVAFILLACVCLQVNGKWFQNIIRDKKNWTVTLNSIILRFIFKIVYGGRDTMIFMSILQ